MGVARGDEQAVHTVLHDLGNAAGAGGDDGPAAGHGIEQRCSEALGHRAHDEQVEALDAAEDVRPKAREKHVLLEVIFAHLLFEVLPQFTFAEDDEPRVGHLLNDQVRGLDEVPLSLVRHQRRDVADDGCMMRQPENLVYVDSRSGGDVIDVNPFVNGDRAFGGHAICDEHPADCLGGGDEAIHLPMLPARERVAVHVKVDAPRRHERRRPRRGGRARSKGKRQRDHRDAVRIVRMDDIWPEAPHHARETPRRRQIHLGPWRDGNQVEAFLHSPPQLAVRVRDERGAVADRPQTVHRQQNLVLAAPPCARRIDMQREHAKGRFMTKSRSTRN